MISLRTTLILGAGASVPYGYPTGSDLVKLILDNLESPSSSGFKQLAEMDHSGSDIQKFAVKLRVSDADSIDEFLRHQPEYAVLGKRAIAQVLIAKEAEHAETSERSPNCWYRLLKAGLLDETSLMAMSGSMLSIITFNYDRSLEHYLHRTLTHAFPHSEKEVVNAINSIRIHHVHGMLGALPWQEMDVSRPYGHPVTSETIVKSASGIKLAHDDGQRRYDSFAAGLIEDAERIIFLGFGFAPSNLKKLGMSHTTYFEKKRVLGTRFKIPHALLEDRIAEFSPLNELRQVPDIDIRSFLTTHETLGKKVPKVRSS